MALDFIRALAAAAVVAGHLRALFFVPLSHLTAPSIAVKLAYAATGLGHQAVLVFFVLSGYLVGGSVLRATRDGRWSWTDYLSRRIARLYIVLLPALVLTAGWDHLGIHYLPSSGLYHFTPEYAYILPFSAADRLGMSTFAGNAMFLQMILVPTFGSNGALWSLTNEWWYYLIFPLLAVRTNSAARRIAGGVVATGMLWFVGAEIAAYFVIWLVGVALAVVPRVRIAGRRDRLVITLGALLLLAGAAGSAEVHRFGRVLDDLGVGVTCAAFLYTVLVWPPTRRPSARVALLWAELAGCSYTLYLVHMPALVFLEALARHLTPDRWAPSPRNALLALAIGAGIVAYAWWVSRFTERNTDAFRRRVVSPLLRRALG